MRSATRRQAVNVMAYVEGWLSNDFPEASAYLVAHMHEMADQMVEDDCAEEEDDQ